MTLLARFSKENKALSTAEDVRTVMDGINSLPEAKPHAKPVAKKAHIQSLADSANALDESTTRQWGKVYNPQASP